MDINYLKQEYEKKLRIIEGKYYVMAKIWFGKGRKEMVKVIEDQGLPSWNSRFDKLWKGFYFIDLKCPDCGNIKVLRLDVDKSYDIIEYKDSFINLICQGCGKIIDINKWIITKEDKHD